MKKINWRVKIGVGFVVLSGLLYLIHYLIFHDAHHIFLYLIGDIAFLPIDVLIVTLVIHTILTNHEKRILLEKLNMLIGTFFSEIGTKLIVQFSDFDPNLEQIKKDLIMDKNWTDEQFAKIDSKLKKYNYTVDMKKFDLALLQEKLSSKRDFLIRLLENPSLLEHESFTELLRAVFHLTEELASRKTLKILPEHDKEHVQGDIKRCYNLLVREWPHFGAIDEEDAN